MDSPKKMLRVEDIMIKDVITVPAEATLKEAARILHEGKFSGTAVVDANGEVVGVISEKDVFRALYPDYYQFVRQEELIPMTNEDEGRRLEILKISMTKNVRELIKEPITTTPGTPLEKIGAMMLLSHGIHRMPVVEGGKLVGIITRRQVYSAIFNNLFEFENEQKQKS